MARQSYHFNSDPDQIADICVRVDDWLIQQAQQTDLRDRTQIILAEILNNVAEHAYSGRKDGKIDLQVQSDNHGLQLMIIDSGRVFPGLPPATFRDPLQFEIDALPEGGFGWALIQSLCTDIKYDYNDPHNIMKVTINADPAAINSDR